VAADWSATVPVAGSASASEDARAPVKQITGIEKARVNRGLFRF